MLTTRNICVQGAECMATFSGIGMNNFPTSNLKVVNWGYSKGCTSRNPSWFSGYFFDTVNADPKFTNTDVLQRYNFGMTLNSAGFYDTQDLCWQATPTSAFRRVGLSNFVQVVERDTQVYAKVGEVCSITHFYINSPPYPAPTDSVIQHYTPGTDPFNPRVMFNIPITPVGPARITFPCETNNPLCNLSNLRLVHVPTGQVAGWYAQGEIQG